jgi:voltage-gated potassium channel
MIARNVVEIILGAVLGVGLIVLFTGNIVSLLEPDTFGDAFEGAWWSLVTMLTVGYGDIVLQSPGGRFLEIGLIVMGIAVIAIVTGLVSYRVGYAMRTPIQCEGCWQRITSEFPYCPYCGKQSSHYHESQTSEPE